MNVKLYRTDIWLGLLIGLVLCTFESSADGILAWLLLLVLALRFLGLLMERPAERVQPPRSPLPQDLTTRAAAKMTGAALDIKQRLYEADAIGCLLDDDDLLQLENGRREILRALWNLRAYEQRRGFRLSCPVISTPPPLRDAAYWGFPVSDVGAGLHEPPANHHS